MKTIKVAAAVIRAGGRILATQRGYGPQKDFWEFPGGKLEPGETAPEALRREIREKLAAEIRVEEHIVTVEMDYPAFHLSMECYFAALVSDRLTLVEHEAARWLSREELEDVDWLPADRLVIEEIRKRW